MSEVTTRMVEGNRLIFLRQIKGKRAQRNIDGKWETLADREVLIAYGM